MQDPFAWETRASFCGAVPQFYGALAIEDEHPLVDGADNLAQSRFGSLDDLPDRFLFQCPVGHGGGEQSQPEDDDQFEDGAAGDGFRLGQQAGSVLPMNLFERG